MGARERRLDMIVSYHHRPSTNLSVDNCRRFIRELRQVAASSFQIDERHLPNYQCLSLDDPVRSLADKVIVCVRLKDTGKMIAFTSAVLLPIPSLPDPVLHLGLTCIIPSALSHGLTKMLVGGIARHYLRTRPDQTVWVSNLAAVVSSLGNIAIFMDEVCPSLRHRVAPTPTHILIAKTIVETPALRESMYLRPDVPFDWEASVFRGSAKGTVFEKGTRRSEGTHRNEALDSFYRG
ncbi:hypothetical protein BDZ89DRAFT_1074987 [Hymenopellis radicata]|nr:hypothetical protein BDZ89DRAFT_1074987 [Hymenopellis radicata]